MNRLLKWLLFVVLLAGYLWAVFLWDRFPSEQKLPGFQDAAAVEVPPEDSVPASEQDTAYYPEDTATVFEVVEEGAMDVPVIDQRSDEPYWVIGGSFSSEVRAVQAQNRLQNNYISSELVFMDPYYRLVLGRHRTEGPAKSMVLDMKALGVDAFVMEMQ